MLLAGCFGDGAGTVEDEEITSIWESYERTDSQSHDLEANFVTVDLRTNQTTNTT